MDGCRGDFGTTILAILLNIYRISANSFRGNYAFLKLEIEKIQTVNTNFNFLHNNLNFCFGNYSREETIQRRKLHIKRNKVSNDVF